MTPPDAEQDYHLEIRGWTGADAPGDQARTALSEATSSRPWLGIYFECCGAYTRVYRNRSETAYAGNCPRCARAITVKIGPGGTACRFFTARE